MRWRRLKPSQSTRSRPEVQRCGNYHFNLRKTLFTVFELGAKTIIVVAKPTAVLTLLTTVKKLADVMKKLSDAQLAVIEALQTVIFRKSSITFKEEGASSEEILALFMERRAEPPGDVPELLRLMAEVDGVLTFRMGADERTKYYALVP